MALSCASQRASSGGVLPVRLRQKDIKPEEVHKSEWAGALLKIMKREQAASVFDCHRESSRQ